MASRADEDAAIDAAAQVGAALLDADLAYLSDGNTYNLDSACRTFAAYRAMGLSVEHSRLFTSYTYFELEQDDWQRIIEQAKKVTDPWSWLRANAGRDRANLLHRLLLRYEGTGFGGDTPATVDLSGPAKDPPWVIEGDAALGRITVLSGDQSSAKTATLVARMRAVVRGENYLDRPTRRGRVLYVTGEEPAEQIADEKLKPLGLTNDDMQSIDLYGQGDFPPIGTDEGNGWLRATVEVGDYVLIIIDTTSSAISGVNGNDNDNVNDLFTYVLEPIVKRAGAAMTLSHHETKSGSRGSSTAAMGARAWTNRASYHLTSAAIGRYAETPTGDGEAVATVKKFVERRPKMRGGGEDVPFVFELRGEKARPNGATTRLRVTTKQSELTDPERLAAACPATRKALAAVLGKKSGDRGFRGVLEEAIEGGLIRKDDESGLYVAGEGTE
jgi:hypothetical protein